MKGTRAQLNILFSLLIIVSSLPELYFNNRTGFYDITGCTEMIAPLLSILIVINIIYVIVQFFRERKKKKKN